MECEGMILHFGRLSLLALGDDGDGDGRSKD